MLISPPQSLSVTTNQCHHSQPPTTGTTKFTENLLTEGIESSKNQNLEVSNIILNHLLDSEQYVQICQNTQYMKKNSLFENKIVYQPVVDPFSLCRTHATKFHQIDR